MALSDEVTVKVKLKFLITFIGALIGASFFVWTLRADVISLLRNVGEHQNVLKSNQESIINMQMDIRSIRDDMKYFRDQYERDMNRYIRDYSDSSSSHKK